MMVRKSNTDRVSITRGTNLLRKTAKGVVLAGDGDDPAAVADAFSLSGYEN